MGSPPSLLALLPLLPMLTWSPRMPWPPWPHPLPAAQGEVEPARPLLLELGGMPDVRHETHSLAAGDLDGDGDVDLVLGNVGFSTAWLNRGDGTFTEVAGVDSLVLHAETNALVLHDLDGDGDLDLFSASGGWFGAIHDLLRNDGKGRFSATTYADVPQDYSWSNGMGIGDIDGDGDPDLFLGRLRHSTWFENDGHGKFTDRRENVPDLEASTMAVVLCDLDGDGDLDAALGNAIYETNRIWINDGHGHFTDDTAARLPPDANDTTALLAADLDGDGDLDLVAGNGRLGGEQPRLYRNDGRGHFTDDTAGWLPTVRCQTMALCAIDIDLDSDLDLVLGNADGAKGAANLLWLNDGKGTFTAAPPGALPDHGERTTCLLATDLDGDGRPELVVGNARENGARTRVYRITAAAADRR
ncbi:MAG: VCBS repeat-containing protein [Planctomycetes bacterium]|nr:VCBS repeat-containing protein [Planctomycetota bacterium]